MISVKMFENFCIFFMGLFQMFLHFDHYPFLQFFVSQKAIVVCVSSEEKKTFLTQYGSSISSLPGEYFWRTTLSADNTFMMEPVLNRMSMPVFRTLCHLPVCCDETVQDSRRVYAYAMYTLQTIKVCNPIVFAIPISSWALALWFSASRHFNKFATNLCENCQCHDAVTAPHL